MSFLNIGIDIGSTTIKYVAVNKKDELIASDYCRHNAQIIETLLKCFKSLLKTHGDSNIAVAFTGSAGLGVAERLQLPFVQEVVAETAYVGHHFPDCKTLINIGGEDAKMVFFSKHQMPEMRMSGNCSGGTGAFLDQMAVLLGCDTKTLSDWALQSDKIYPMASRCGVFSKTDVQNLISRNVSKNDIAASIFHAVAVQIVGGLSRGLTIEPPLILSGGPFHFLPALKKALLNYLNLEENAVITTPYAALLTAWGAALSHQQAKFGLLSDFIRLLEEPVRKATENDRLEVLFKNQEAYSAWKSEKENNFIPHVSLENCSQNLYLGIDSGSTTGKIVILDDEERIVFTHYTHNQGNPIQSIVKGLELFLKKTQEVNRNFYIAGSCVTGYGEDLIKTAFNLDHGIVETMAHYLGAQNFNPDVSFILDIGGQDMKALFIKEGMIHRVEINEACSSGCGSFIEAFAQSLNISIQDFTKKACLTEAPCDLGTRCTVFMNSKVKQFLREGAKVEDIAGGLSYSVIKNCLFKVLRIKSFEELGNHITVQGGTMKNHAVVRALENLTQKPVSFTNIPELMGAYGCALYAKKLPASKQKLETFLFAADYETKKSQCKGCENQCQINVYTFFGGQHFISGNQCEKVFSNKGHRIAAGENIYPEKYKLLFDRPTIVESPLLRIGIPRALGIYENYPFWHALFTNCGIEVVLSSSSNYKDYENALSAVMSDNICFPAKLMHSHIDYLITQKVDRIFYPFTVFEEPDDELSVNSYNCPIVTAYSQVLSSKIPLDAPVISFKNTKTLKKICTDYLQTLNISKSLINRAFNDAVEAQKNYRKTICRRAEAIFEKAQQGGKPVIVLAGRPYHTDPLVQHKLSEMIAGFGVAVISEDIVRAKNIDTNDTFSITQWNYVNRILKAAKWVTQQNQQVQLMQMTSFGCGPDAFLLDEMKYILERHHKTLTILKIDDVNHLGSLRLRVRSLVESLEFSQEIKHPVQVFTRNKIFQKEDRKRLILAPYFSEFQSPILEPIFKLGGYNFKILPPPDRKSVEMGLTVAHNEVCYPATLVLGDLIKALKSGDYDLNKTAVALTQTGGQCRATNYSALLKKALIDHGMEHIPFVAITTEGALFNPQPGFKLPWIKLAPILIKALIFSDCLSKLHAASIVREIEVGVADKLKTHYLNALKSIILKNKPKQVFTLLEQAVSDFRKIVKSNVKLPQIGVVGEIYLKFNGFSHKHILDFLRKEGLEVLPPLILPFFLQTFVNRKVNRQSGLLESSIPDFVFDAVYGLISKYLKNANKICENFPYFTPMENIFEEAEEIKDVLDLNCQFGEGWLLPAEIGSFYKKGVHHIVSLQPFGCIANHIISKGIEKKLKSKYPSIHILSLDFDAGTSEVNVLNRLYLFAESAKTKK